MSRLRADNLSNRAADGAPLFTHGVRVTGVVTSTTGDFSGNVSIGGTLTYEDVSNVDSVGLITARTGVRVTSGGVQISDGGLSVTGIATFNDDIIGDNATNISGINSVTATSFHGDGSNLSGIEGGVANFVASGSISDGSLVVVNTDGTVSVISETGTTNPSLGSPVEFDASTITYKAAVYDPTNNRVVIAFTDVGNSNYGTAIVGTVSGDSISFGTPVVFESASSIWHSATFDSTNDKVVIAYSDGGNNSFGTAIVGTVSGTSISFGTPTVFGGVSSQRIKAVYDSTNEKVVIVWSEANNSLEPQKAIVGTVSGTSISFGSAVPFNGTNVTNDESATFDSTNDKVIIAFRDQTDNNYGKAIVGTVSGTSITFGDTFIFSYETTVDISTVYNSVNQRFVIAYSDWGNGRYGTAITGFTGGIGNTSISYGFKTVFNPGNTDYISATYDSGNNKVVIGYKDIGNSNYGTAIVGVLTGSTIGFGTEIVFESSTTNWITGTYDSTNEKVVIAYNGDSVVIESDSLSSNLTAENYIGIAGEAISDGATGKINIVGGINSSQTGLTTAQTYYVQSDGTLNTTTDVPSVVAGTSISSTEIIVKG